MLFSWIPESLFASFLWIQCVVRFSMKTDFIFMI